MSDAPQDLGAALHALLAEGEMLLQARPHCHKTLNDFSAAMLICKMHDQGFQVSLPMARDCIARMKIAVETGEYPDHLLEEAKGSGGRLA